MTSLIRAAPKSNPVRSRPTEVGFQTPDCGGARPTEAGVTWAKDLKKVEAMKKELEEEKELATKTTAKITTKKLPTIYIPLYI